MLFREKRFSMQYSVAFVPDTKSLYILTIPTLSLCEEKMNNDTLIDEYDPTSILPVKCSSLVAHQCDTVYREFTVAINKVVLPIKPDFKWDVFEKQILSSVGRIAKMVTKNVMVETGGSSVVVFGVDVVLDQEMKIHVTELHAKCSLPSMDALKGVVGLALGQGSDKFVKVL